MTSKQLSKKDFTAALQRGQGRAFLHVREYGLEDVADLVLEACLHNQAYDPQCERSRAKWLFEMFQDTSEYKRFAASILKALASETDTWDLQQLCELAALMSIRGDEEAHSVLRTRVMQQAAGTDDNSVGASELVRVEGFDAVVQLARCYGKRILKDGEEYPPTLDLLYQDEVPIEARKTLKELSSSDPEIKAYWEHNLQYETISNDDLNSKEKYREHFRQQYPLQKILENAAAEASEYPSYYLGFGRAATQEELEIVFGRLISEPNEQVCVRLLWVFRMTKMPRLHPRLWEFVKSDNERIRNAAFRALSQFKDQSVGELGRHELQAGALIKDNYELLELFVKNYQPEDGHLISSAIRNIDPEAEYTHWTGMNVFDICKENHAPELIEALKWVYEYGPCTSCRESAVEHMLKLKMIDPEIMEECFFDANEEIQRIAREVVK